MKRLEQDAASQELQRARRLLQGWLALADKLPVHDLLDRIYFEGDVPARYAAVLPPEMRAKVVGCLSGLIIGLGAGGVFIEKNSTARMADGILKSLIARESRDGHVLHKTCRTKKYHRNEYTIF